MLLFAQSGLFDTANVSFTSCREMMVSWMVVIGLLVVLSMRRSGVAVQGCLGL